MMLATPLRRPEMGDLVAGTPAHQRAQEQSVLEDLLKAAMEEQVVKEPPEQVAHKLKQLYILFTTLIREYIIGMVDSSGLMENQDMVARIPQILDLLVNRIEQYQELSVTHLEEEEAPEGFQINFRLYRWLIPRLLHGASVLVHSSLDNRLHEHLVRTVVTIIVNVGEQLYDHEAAGVSHVGELLRGLVETCDLLATGTTSPGSLFRIKTANSSSPSHFDDPTLPEYSALYTITYPESRVALSLAVFIIHSVTQSFLAQTLPWRYFLTDVLTSLVPAMLKVSETLRINNMRSGSIAQTVIARHQIMLLQDIVDMWKHPDIFPLGVAESLAFPVVQAIQDYCVSLASHQDVDMDEEIDMSPDTLNLARLLMEALSTARSSRLGRAGGNFWQLLSGAVQGLLSLGLDVSKNVSVWCRTLSDTQLTVLPHPRRRYT